jgi:OOP family OmpA-OmpF porin
MWSGKNFRLTVLLCTALLFALSACAGKQQAKVEPIPVSENPSEHLNRLEADLGAGINNQLNVLAPVSFASAESYFNSAKQGLEGGGQLSSILENISNSRAYLKRADEVAGLSRPVLSDAITARDYAREAGATAFQWDYAEAEEKFLEMTRAIEDGDLKKAEKNKEKVAEEFRQLEIRAIKEQTIGEVRSLIDAAEKEGAKKLVPDTLADAQATLNEADAFITEKPHEKEEMLGLASKALFKAQRLTQLTAKAKEIKEMKPEQVALWVEGELQKPTEKLGAADMRNESFDTQVENIVASINALQKDRQFMADKVKAQQSDMVALKEAHRAEIEGLTAKHNDEIAAMSSRQKADIEEMNRNQQAEISAMNQKHQAEVIALTKQIASLEGKTREEQAEKERLVSEKLLAEERLAAEKRANEERMAAQRKAEEERMASEKRAAEERLALEKKALEDRMSAEKRFNQLYVEAQNYFKPEDAEFYKKGTQLIIRLRAMQFPVGKAVIMPENYELLSSVQRAIRTFGEPDVTIEGHTDSTGSVALNEHLSQQRAESVRKYLLANKTLPEGKIVAVGYGSKRPLASNETPEGRAINRRIDIIISPQMGQ